MTYKDLLVCLKLEQISAQQTFKKMFDKILVKAGINKKTKLIVFFKKKKDLVL
jgi:hypothetical protein